MPAAPWDAAAADEVLARVRTLLDRAERYDATSQARKNVLAVYRDVIEGYHRQRDALLFESLAAVEGLLGRWREQTRSRAGKYSEKSTSTR